MLRSLLIDKKTSGRLLRNTNIFERYPQHVTSNEGTNRYEGTDLNHQTRCAVKHVASRMSSHKLIIASTSHGLGTILLYEDDVRRCRRNCQYGCPSTGPALIRTELPGRLESSYPLLILIELRLQRHQLWKSKKQGVRRMAITNDQTEDLNE